MEPERLLAWVILLGGLVGFPVVIAWAVRFTEKRDRKAAKLSTSLEGKK